VVDSNLPGQIYQLLPECLGLLLPSYSKADSFALVMSSFYLVFLDVDEENS
jgi:hypothetical protein